MEYIRWHGVIIRYQIIKFLYSQFVISVHIVQRSIWTDSNYGKCYILTPEYFDSLNYSEHFKHSEYSNTLNRVERFESVRLLYELEGV